MKMAVCDHCRAHGLPCDTQGVCEQCKLYKAACIRHWCKLSRKSEALCSRRNCRCVHDDAIPDHSLVLPGKISEYASRGYVPMEKASRVGKTYGKNELTKRLGGFRDIQLETQDAMTEMVRNGEATWETVAGKVGCSCAAIQEWEKEEQQQERLRRGKMLVAPKLWMSD